MNQSGLTETMQTQLSGTDGAQRTVFVRLCASPADAIHVTLMMMKNIQHHGQLCSPYEFACFTVWKSWIW